MYVMKTTVRFLDKPTVEGGVEVKPPVEHVYDDVTKGDILEHEDHLMDVLKGMNKFAKDVEAGKIPRAASTNPVTMEAEFLVEKDGALWTKQENVWPNMGDEAQAVLIGVFNGQLGKRSKGLLAKARAWRDSFWGWGPDKRGQNMLGKLWMRVREEQRATLAAQRQTRKVY